MVTGVRRSSRTPLAGLVGRLLLALALLGIGRPTVAVEPATLRIVAHPEVVRLVVEAPSIRALALDLAGGAAHLRLDRGRSIDVPPVPAPARARLLAVEARDGGARLALALAPDALARLVDPGPGRVVVDLVHAAAAAETTPIEPAAPPPSAAPPAPASPEAARDTLRVRTGSHPGYRRVVLEGRAVAALRLRLEPGRIELEGPDRALSEVASGLRRLGPPIERVDWQAGRLSAELAAEARATRRGGRPDQIVLDLPIPASTASAGARSEAGPAGAAERGRASTAPGDVPPARAGGRSGPDAPAARPPASACQGGASTARLCVRLQRAADGEEVVLDAGARPGAAVLRRAGALWIVLDRVVETVEIEDGAPDRSNALLRALRREAHPRATVLRLETAWPVAAEMLPWERGWRLDLRPGADAQAPEERWLRRRGEPPALVIEAAGSVLALPAELVGEDLAVLAASEPVTRSGPRRLVDLELLDAVQGLAWRSISGDLQIREVEGRWLIDRLGGLRLTPPENPTLVPPAGAETALRSEPLASDVAIAATPDGALASERRPSGLAEGGTAAQSAPPQPADPTGTPPVAELREEGADPRGSIREAGEASGPPLRPAQSEPAVAAARPPGVDGRSAGRPAGSAAGVATPAAESPIGLATLAPQRGTARAAPVAGPREGRAAVPSEPGPVVDPRLAREALAKARAAEALAVLGEPAAASEPDAEPPSDATVRALAGVAAVLLDRVRAGERLLDDARLAGDPEVALWRAVAAARRTDWPAAARALAASGRTFHAYPPALQLRLAPLLARALLEEGRTAAALAVVDLAKRLEPEPREAARLALVEALCLLREGSPDAAAAALRAAIEGGDRTTSLEARYRLARLEHDRRGSPPAELAAELDRQRLLWRDHPIEPEMLDGLIAARLAAGRVGDALALARELVARYPGSASASAAVERIPEWFGAALEGAGAPVVDPLPALRLLRANPDLVPAGEAGAALVRALARRLAAADLPGAAAAVLAEHGLPRLAGAARAELALEVAELRLRAGEAAAALVGLDAEPALGSGDAPTLARVEALRRAALAAVDGRGAPDRDPEGGLARLEAAWRSRDWRAVAEVGLALLATPDRPEADERALVLRVALALAADGRAEAARALVARHRPPADGPEGRLLELVAGSSPLRGDALEVAALIDGEVARLRSGLARGR